MKTVYCIGELLIDFVAEKQGADLSKATEFTKKAGGAPANVACAISKLGGKGVFIGAVGKDPFGDFLVNILQENKVNIDLVQRSNIFTTLAFVSLAEDGERDFVFSRGADKYLTYNNNLTPLFKGNILHFGAATALLGGDLETTYLNYFNDAVAQNAFISFDPNFRIDLWKGNEATFIKKCIPFIEKAHLCKFSLEEAQLISGKTELAKCCEVLHKMGTQIITITLGAEGTYVSTKFITKTIPSIKVSPVDTTGAGDAFIGCLLQQIAELDNPNKILNNFEQLTNMIINANTAGALTTTGYGAIPSLPTKEQVF